MPETDSRVRRALYNLDRVIASLFGAPPQETISSQAGRARDRGRWWGRMLCRGLDWLDPCHCADAVRHADLLDKVDDGVEQ